MILTGIRIPGKLRKAGRRDLKGGPMLMEKAFAFPAKTVQTGVSERRKRLLSDGNGAFSGEKPRKTEASGKEKAL